MPKKKKGAKKKGTKKKSEGKTKAELEAVGPTELELSLRLELASLETELTRAKLEAEEARVQHEWLREEVQKTRDETKDYESYMRKKTVREQAKIQGLSDQNQRELDNIELEKARRTKEFELTKKDLRDRILEKEGELQRINTQLNELTEFKERRDAQEDEICKLEASIKNLELGHFEQLQKLKSSYLDEKITFQQEATRAVQELEQQAAQEAVDCLSDHSGRVTRENKRLRGELLELFAKNKALREAEQRLKSENKDLIRQQELNLDMSDQQASRMTRRLSRSMVGTLQGTARLSLA